MEREQRGRAARADTGSCGAIALQRKCDTFPTVSPGDARAATSQEGREGERERSCGNRWSASDGRGRTRPLQPSHVPVIYLCSAPPRLHLPRLSTDRPRPSELPSPRVHTYSLPEVNARLQSPFVTGGATEDEERALGKARRSINLCHAHFYPPSHRFDL